MAETNQPQIVLASQSPRRRALLEQVGIRPRIWPVDIDEARMVGEPAAELAVRLAGMKANAVARAMEQGSGPRTHGHTAAESNSDVVMSGKSLVVGADTIVCLGDIILGKPRDARDAEKMLGMLSGKKHSVISGVCVVDADNGETACTYETTQVFFKDLAQSDIRTYVASGEPLDKAGAYGIQGLGALLVRKIEGCYFNVVGLPLATLGDLFSQFGVRML